MTIMNGVIFSDLGVAASFMSLDWVQSALRETLGFAPFPATLNVRPMALADAEVWRRKRKEAGGVALRSGRGGFCDARLLPIRVGAGAAASGEWIPAAILVPEVEDYPSDKIEIVAPMRLKDRLGVNDGDALTLEFLN